MESTTHLELHSQATRLVVYHAGRLYPRARTGLAPSMTFHSMKVLPGLKLGLATLDHNSTPCGADFQVEHFPLHSPLLWESLLVSFPPLSYMLKSSGSSYLISGQKLNCSMGTCRRHCSRKPDMLESHASDTSLGAFCQAGPKPQLKLPHHAGAPCLPPPPEGCDGKECATHRSE